MPERRDERDDRVAIAIADEEPLSCQVCGVRQPAPARVLCAACGEPVLRWGWAP